MSDKLDVKMMIVLEAFLKIEFCRPQGRQHTRTMKLQNHSAPHLMSNLVTLRWGCPPAPVWFSC